MVLVDECYFFGLPRLWPCVDFRPHSFFHKIVIGSAEDDNEIFNTTLVNGIVGNNSSIGDNELGQLTEITKQIEFYWMHYTIADYLSMMRLPGLMKNKNLYP